jgi:hypothetical protein
MSWHCSRHTHMAVARVKHGHHTVPRFYLDGFANDNQQLGVARLSAKKRFQGSTGDATVVKEDVLPVSGPYSIAEVLLTVDLRA